MGDILLISTSEDKGGSSEALFPGRVPHVRLSVHGPKKMGAAPSTAFVTRVKGLWPRARILAQQSESV
jgi:hypothetical protein